MWWQPKFIIIIVIIVVVAINITISQSGVWSCLLPVSSPVSHRSLVHLICIWSASDLRRITLLIRGWSMVNCVYEDGAIGPSQFIDAGEVFTGPANSSALSSNRRSVFCACLDRYNDSNCQLSSNLWTAQSKYVIPVAYMHGSLAAPLSWIR